LPDAPVTTIRDGSAGTWINGLGLVTLSDYGAGGGAVTVTVVVLIVVLIVVLVVVLVTTLVVVLGSTVVVVDGGVLVSVIVTVSVDAGAVAVAVAEVVVAVGVIGVSAVVGVLSDSSEPEPKTAQTINASRSVTSTPAANIAAGVRYHGMRSSGGGPTGGRRPPCPSDGLV
jgi:hypothetical protein